MLVYVDINAFIVWRDRESLKKAKEIIIKNTIAPSCVAGDKDHYQ